MGQRLRIGLYVAGNARAERDRRSHAVSTTGAYLPLWFGLLTARLPLHRQLWEIVPCLLFLATASTIGWSVAQVASRRAAVLATLIVLVASPWALAFFIAPVAHNTVYPTTALLGAYLIWLTRADRRRRSVSLVVPVLATVGLGVCIASDALLIVTGVIPFAVTAVLVAVRRNRRSDPLVLSALATVAGAIPIAALTSAIMRSAGYRTLPPPAELALPSTLPEHAQLLFNGLERLFNGYLGHRSPGLFDALTPPASGPLHSELGFACDIVLAAALIALIAVGAGTTIRFIRSEWRGGDPGSPAQLGRASHVIYWLSSAAVTCAAFMFSTKAMVRHESYFATVIFSVAAVVPLLMRRGSVARWLIPAGASIIFAGSLVGLTSHYLDTVYEPPIANYRIVRREAGTRERCEDRVCRLLGRVELNLEFAQRCHGATGPIMPELLRRRHLPVLPDESSVLVCAEAAPQLSAGGPRHALRGRSSPRPRTADRKLSGWTAADVHIPLRHRLATGSSSGLSQPAGGPDSTQSTFTAERPAATRRRSDSSL